MKRVNNSEFEKGSNLLWDDNSYWNHYDGKYEPLSEDDIIGKMVRWLLGLGCKINRRNLPIFAGGVCYVITDASQRIRLGKDPDLYEALRLAVESEGKE